MRFSIIGRVLATVVAAVLCAAMFGCPKDSGGNQSASTEGGSGGKMKLPSGVYESKMPDGTVIRIDFAGGGAARMSMIEGGVEEGHGAKWIINGESILLEGADGMTLQLTWKGDALVSDFGGMTITFTKP